MSQEAFNAFTKDFESTTLLITSTGSSAATALPFKGDAMIAVRSNPVYLRWGKADTVVSASTAATQGFWLPTNALIRVHIPDDSTHLVVLQDGGAAQVFLTPGAGI